MEKYSTILVPVLNTLVTVLLPVLAGYVIKFLAKKLGREKFLLARELIFSIVASLEQQYRAGEIAKDDRFALALEWGIKRTGLTEEQVAHLISEAVFQINVQLKKYDYTTVDGLKLDDQSMKVTEQAQTAKPVLAEPDPLS